MTSAEPWDLARLQALEGLIPPAVGLELYRRALEVPPWLEIVELGSYRGKSTAHLAAGARDGGPWPDLLMGARPTVWAVDPWETQPPPGTGGRDFYGFADPDTRAAFAAQLHGLELDDVVEQVVGYSTDTAARWDPEHRVGLLYVDANHTADAVLADVDAWWPHLATRGEWAPLDDHPTATVIVFDDYGDDRNPGVRQAVDHLAELGRFDRLELVDRLAVAFPNLNP